MAGHTSYTTARANFAKLCNQVTRNREAIIISRRGAEDVALVAAAELSSLMETAHLLRSPKNAERIFKALNRALAGEGKPQTVDELRKELALGEEARKTFA
ncbi:MAG: type II toxin-antitoxin system prevent-host-death family antitoxin [Pirellulales bacterium]